MSTRILSFKDAIREAQDQLMDIDPSVIVIGEGVPDPKAVFGTTTGLHDKFKDRVFDMPISENGMTGVCIGAALNGLKPILVHMRIDFALYSFDQIVNNAAKWFSMYGGQQSVPLVIRLLVGWGWGQGNQHSQNLTAMFAHVPGLKVFVPSNAHDAKGMLVAAVRDPNPVMFIEHRWLYDTTSDVPEYLYAVDKPECFKECGEDVTIVSSGHATLEVTKAIEFLKAKGIDPEHIDLRSIKPLNKSAILLSVQKTRRLVVVDDAWRFCGLAAEIIATVCEDPSISLLSPPIRVTYPDYPSGSSPHLTANYYNGPYDICLAVERSLGKPLSLLDVLKYQQARTHDVPDQNFKGPF
jgi:pyruvate dehydrogenase E1 component beta subunit